MLKSELRLNYRKKRSLLHPDLIESQSILVANRILDLPIWHFFYFHIFLSIAKNKELDTTPLLSLLQGRDKQVVIPKMDLGRSMKNYLLTDTTVLRHNDLGIPEPLEGIEVPEEKLDVVFVPLLAFDEQGHRAGYGKGYYDVFLKKCRKDVVKIGLSFFGPVKRIGDTHEDDVALDYCVTPDAIYDF